MKYTGSSMGSYFTELTRDDYNVFLQYYGPQEFRLIKPQNPYTEDGEVTFLFPNENIILFKN